MMRRARRSAQIGNLWDAVGGAAEGVFGEVGDTIEDVGNAISDSGAEIGAVLKVVASIVALWPGVGTGLALAIGAAGAYAAGDKIDDAVVSTVSAAIPGVPRVFFNVAADMTQTIYRGGDVKAAALRGMRKVASSTGGERAVAAFDTGLAVGRGQKIKDATWALARSNAAQGGTAALAAFDAGSAVANGGGATDAVLAIGHDYAASMGPLAGSAFEIGAALGTGKSLQEAGFAGLKAFVSGNELGERGVVFGEKLTLAIQRGEPVDKLLADELVADVDRYGAAFVRSGVADDIKRAVADKLDEILPRWDREWDALGSFELAERLNVPEIIARAAQAVMRDFVGGGGVDQPLLDRLTKTGIQSAIEKYGAGVVASRALNATYAEEKASIRSDQLTMVARMPSKSLSYATAKAEQAPPVIVAVAPIATPRPPSSSRSSLTEDLALGGVIGAAAVALFFWAKA